MIFTETKLRGAYVIDIERNEDERGFFGRSWCQQEFLSHGLNPLLVQCNISSNKKQGTLRGMHFQIAPFEESKLVRCSQGAIYDVIIDIRPKSETYMQWYSIELTSENHRSVFIPEGFAHGFQTLVDDTEVFYQMSDYFHPECARGICWNDLAFSVIWPIDNVIISEKDKNYQLWSLV